MEKRTILAIVISAVIVVGYFLISPLLSPKPATPTVSGQPSVAPSSGSGGSPVPSSSAAAATGANPGVQPNSQLLDPAKAAEALVALPAKDLSNDLVTYQNSKLAVKIDPKGAKVVSVVLVQHADHDGPVQLLYPGEGAGLTTRFGGKVGQEMTEVFALAPNKPAGTYEFYRDYQVNNTPGKTIRVTKRYTFKPDDYLFQLDVGFKYVSTVVEVLPNRSLDAFYTMALGPQIGPLSSKINGSQDYRNFVYLIGDKREQPGIGPGNEQTIKDLPKWLSVDGKYFAFIFVPPNAHSQITMATTSLKDAAGTPGNQVYFSRDYAKTGEFEDSWHFYAGPKLAADLESYNKAVANPWGLQDLRFDQITGFNLLSWLETPLKEIMKFFVTIIPNWGIAIILLTILVKGALFPLSHRAAKSTYRMQQLQPKLTSLREKYKDNPQKMNQEMMAIYQKEKINPLGGCLPLLLQMPFFIAMYSLFNNHFDLRGASFIPGWIGDLSQPETLIHFSLQVPLLPPVTGLHLLPILYVASQIITSKLTQVATPGQSNRQMQLMMYGLPIVFFFILYEAPSGLLVYWIFQNILQLGQQLLVNRMLKKKANA